MPPPFVYINGYPGVGKLSVARELLKLMQNGKILDNHQLIDPVASVFERSMPEYQPLRRKVRQDILTAIATSTSSVDTAWIFTDQQSSSLLGSTAAKDYEEAAVLKRAPFISVILKCDIEENLRRLSGAGRGSGSNTKLTDTDILRKIRESEDIFHFGGPRELELGVSSLSPKDAAQKIHDFVGFKHVFVKDILSAEPDTKVELLCWLKSKPRHHGSVVFVDGIDSTGTMQIVLADDVAKQHPYAPQLVPESSMFVTGVLSSKATAVEIRADGLTIISKATEYLTPSVRSTGLEILSSKNTNRVLNLRHVLLEKPGSLGTQRVSFPRF